jgi:hypothetical protein
MSGSSNHTFATVPDPALLTEIGNCPIVLRRPVVDHEMNAVLTHDLKEHGSFVCYKAGIVEPITFFHSEISGWGRRHSVQVDQGGNGPEFRFRC